MGTHALGRFAGCYKRVAAARDFSDVFRLIAVVVTY